MTRPGPEFPSYRALETQLGRFPKMNVLRTRTGNLLINYPNSSAVDRQIELNPFRETPEQPLPFVSVIVKDFNTTTHAWDAPVQFVLKPVGSNQYEVTQPDDKPQIVPFGTILEYTRLGLSIMTDFLKLDPATRLFRGFGSRVVDELSEREARKELAATMMGQQTPDFLPDIEPKDYVGFMQTFLQRTPITTTP